MPNRVIRHQFAKGCLVPLLPKRDHFPSQLADLGLETVNNRLAIINCILQPTNIGFMVGNGPQIFRFGLLGAIGFGKLGNEIL
jgi:hypothetical protein